MFFYTLIKIKRFWFVLLLPLSAILTALAHRYPHLTERWFSQGIYRIFTEIYGRVFGYLPFSVSQFLIILFPLIAIAYVVYEIWSIFTKVACLSCETEYICPKRRLQLENGHHFHGCKKYFARLLATTGCTVGIIAFTFTIFAGLNYARLEFGEIIGLDIRPSYVEELVALAEVLAESANEWGAQVNRNAYGEMILSTSHFRTAHEARAVFSGAAEEFPVLEGFVPIAKPIIYSHFMSRLRITGIYSPFTMEAHVNIHVPDYHIPATMLHELAHFRGIMREDEANFIAWLTGIRSDNPDFAYSSAMMALVHTVNQLNRVSPDDFRIIMNSLSVGVHTDLAANRAYWQQFTGPLAEISTAANDRYLRANRQQDGVASYGQMVDLLLAYFRNI